MFKECSGGLYYDDMTNMEHNIINSQITDWKFLNTVESNKAYLCLLLISYFSASGKALISGSKILLESRIDSRTD